MRHGTQTLIAALEIAADKVLAHVRNRRTSVNFLRFMNEVVRAYPHRELHEDLLHRFLASYNASGSAE